jgi:hypothetical protein
LNLSQSIQNTSRVEGGTDMKKRGKEVDHMTKKEKEMGKKENKGERGEMNTEEE